MFFENFLTPACPIGTAPLEKMSKNVDFSLWGKQCILSSQNGLIFRVLAHCVSSSDIFEISHKLKIAALFTNPIQTTYLKKKLIMKLTHPHFSTKMFHIHIWYRASNFQHILICCRRSHDSSWYLGRVVYPCYRSDQRKNLQKSKIQLRFDCLGKNNAEFFHANRYQSKCLRANDLIHRVCYRLVFQVRFSFHPVGCFFRS